MNKPTVILATSNGIGMGHLARASAIAKALKSQANPIIVSMAGGIAEIPDALGIPCEYIPGKDRRWMPRPKWDLYLRDRLVALIDETDAKVLTYDGVVPYAGVIAARIARPNVKLIWIRRGLWQKKIHRFALPLQSAAMDLVIEPGDYAFAYDHGPTSKRKDAIRTVPVSLYQSSEALNKEESRKILGLDQNRPAVLVQLGTGADDANEKMTAALKGLLGWPDLQVVLTKEPVAKNGKSLAPEGLDIKVIRYFPLAKVLAAFDAGICATGYNGVHELLAAKLPTVFISNIRGMDDQEARAKWCHDFGYALRANQADLKNITETVKELQDANLRAALSFKCAELPAPIGGEEIANKLLKLISAPSKSNNLARVFLFQSLRYLAIGYRSIVKQKSTVDVSSSAPIFSNSTVSTEMQKHIRSGTRFEHLIASASEKYLQRRRQIADTYYDL
ncbi:MAG: UDP-N-acetylglucosamine--LPS N-acetylglucosamine transferase [Candidatus Nanopelagicaceae bacterium]|nr:UDP-N-acetylglucosamine--LPS N-acetylglucosamine transferase [Candidatus Nanopelagicaceae bacterium]